MQETVWLKLPNGNPVEVEATPEKLIPMMVKGYMQCPAPGLEPPAPEVNHE